MALWLTRRWLTSDALPAGTDFLGVINRAHENAHWDTLLSPWDPGSFGAMRTVTVDSLLGLATLVTGNAVTTVKLAALGTLLLAGSAAYLVAWRWYGRRSVAAIAGILFMTSHACLSRWGSGQLNVELALALAPVVIYLWVRCIEHPSLRDAMQLALGIAAVTFVRPDMALYVAPSLAVHLLVRGVIHGRRELMKATVRTAAYAVPAVVALNLVQILPLAVGLRSRWLSSGNLFDRQDLFDRSLDALPSLLGFSREIGYFAFTGQQTWFSHPWVPQPVFFAAAAAVVLLAYAAVLVRRDERTLFLALAATVAAFIGKGIHGPVARPYLWAADHLPVVGNLRGTNRWLIVEALAYSILGAITLVWLGERVLARWPGSSRVRGIVLGVAAAMVAAVLAFPVAPTLVTGLRTWRPDPGQLALMDKARDAPKGSLIATVPYDQSVRFVSQRGYRGYEHDLGAESALFTGHSAVGDGGWNQRAADFTAWSSRALTLRDAALPEVLGSLGVSRILAFDYPATSPHLCPPGAIPEACTRQQQAIAAMPQLQRITSNGAGTLYGIKAPSPRVSFRRNVGIVLGGRSGLAALAATPGVDLPRWATFTADDVLATSGLDGLIRLIRVADRVQIADATSHDVAILAAPALVRAAGITNDPRLERKTQLLTSDESARAGALAEQRIAPPAAVATTQTKFKLGRRRRVELWARMAIVPAPAELTFRLDDSVVGRKLPVGLARGAFQWALIGTRDVPKGSHNISLRATRSPLGSSYEVDEVLVVDPAARLAAQRRIDAALKTRHDRVQYGFSTPFLSAGVISDAQRSPVDALGRTGAAFWTAAEPDRTRRVGQGFAFTSKRKLYTLVQHRFGRVQDWASRRYLFVRYRGTGEGQAYRLLVDFDRARRSSRSVSFVDDRAGAQTIGLRLPLSSHGRSSPASHVWSLRIATDRTDVSGSFFPGSVALSAKLGEATVSYPLVRSARPRPVAAVNIARASEPGRTVGLIRPAAAMAHLRVTPEEPDPARRITISAGTRVRQLSDTKVVSSGGDDAYVARFNAARTGALVLAQGFDARWLARGTQGTIYPVPAGSVVNGYLYSRGEHSVRIELRGRRVPVIGLAGSLFALLAVGYMAAGGTLRGLPRRRGDG